MDDDVVMLALLGIALLLVGGFTFAYSFFGVLTGNVLVAAGAVIDVGATAVHYSRRGRHAIQYEILRFLKEQRAYPEGSGEFPTVVQRHVGVPTDRFERYVKDLVQKSCIKWTPEKKLVLMSRGMGLLGNEDLSVFFREGGETE